MGGLGFRGLGFRGLGFRGLGFRVPQNLCGIPLKQVLGLRVSGESFLRSIVPLSGKDRFSGGNPYFIYLKGTAGLECFLKVLNNA